MFLDLLSDMFTYLNLKQKLYRNSRVSESFSAHKHHGDSKLVFVQQQCLLLSLFMWWSCWPDVTPETQRTPHNPPTPGVTLSPHHDAGGGGDWGLETNISQIYVYTLQTAQTTTFNKH